MGRWYVYSYTWVIGLLLLTEAQGQTLLSRRHFLGVEYEECDCLEGGILVKGVYEGTAAEKIGLRAGDKLVEVNQVHLKDAHTMIDFIKNYPQQLGLVTFKVIREGKTLTLKGMLKEYTSEYAPDLITRFDAIPYKQALLRTILTLPKSKGKYPAVLFIPGASCYSIDTPLDTTYANTQLMRRLSRHQIVTMRVDKPGVGDSRGGLPCEKIDFRDEYEVFQEALKKLKTYDFIDTTRIFLIGHSTGGVIAPIIASQEPVKGIIVFGTMGRNWTEYLIESRKLHLKHQENTPEEIETYLKEYSSCSNAFFNEKNTFNEVVAQYPPCNEILEKFSFRTEAYWYQLADIKVLEQWAKYKGHLLSLWGEYDTASLEADHQLIVQKVNAFHPGKGTYLKLENTNHKMAQVKGVEEEDCMKNFNPEIAEVIIRWMKSIK